MTGELVAATPAHANALAAIHAACFPPRERWSENAMALQLAQPGGFGVIDPSGGMVLARIAADLQASVEVEDLNLDEIFLELHHA